MWVAAPAEPAGEEWSAEALDRLRARLAAKQALCAELDGRLVCLAGVRGMAGAAVMEALGALSAPRALVGQGEAVDDLRDAGTSYRRALAALRVAAHEESGTASWDALGVERVVTALPTRRWRTCRTACASCWPATSRSCGRSRPISTTRAT